MRKNNFTLAIFLLIGLLVGMITGHLLSGMESLAFLTKATNIVWEPSADLQVIKYDLHVVVKLNLISVLGMIGAFWLYRRM